MQPTPGLQEPMRAWHVRICLRHVGKVIDEQGGHPGPSCKHARRAGDLQKGVGRAGGQRHRSTQAHVCHEQAKKQTTIKQTELGKTTYACRHSVLWFSGAGCAGGGTRTRCAWARCMLTQQPAPSPCAEQAAADLVAGALRPPSALLVAPLHTLHGAPGSTTHTCTQMFTHAPKTHRGLPVHGSPSHQRLFYSDQAGAS